MASLPKFREIGIVLTSECTWIKDLLKLSSPDIVHVFSEVEIPFIDYTCVLMYIGNFAAELSKLVHPIIKFDWIYIEPDDNTGRYLQNKEAAIKRLKPGGLLVLANS